MIAVIGAGIEGLSIGLKLLKEKQSFIILEKEKRIGGLLKSHKIDNFVFDTSGHLLHTDERNIIKYIEKLTKKKFNKISRKARIYSKGVYTEYPYQLNTYGLPQNVIDECRKGLLDIKDTEPDFINYSNWIYSVFGKGIAENFMIPYNKKFFKCDLENITCDWVNKYIPKPSLEEFDKGSKQRIISDKGYNQFFYYPDNSGIEIITESMSSEIGNDYIKLNTNIKEIDINNKNIILNDNKIIKYDTLYSTIPLYELGKLLKSPPDYIKESFEDLDWISVKVLNIGIKSDNLNDSHWIYFPEDKYKFFRIGCYHNISQNLAPENCVSFYIEFTYRENFELNIEENIKHLTNMGLIEKKHKIETYQIIDIPYGYVVFDKKRNKAVKNIQDFLLENDIILSGRYGEWNYTAMSDSLKKLITG